MTNEIEVRKDNQGALVTYDYGQDAQLGFQNTSAADFAVPFINVLQALSPEINDPAKKVPGAAAGMLINNVTKSLIPGETGLIFVPCLTTHKYTQWTPRDAGGGFRGAHEPTSKIVLDAKAKAAGSFDLVTPTGDTLEETFYIYGLILDSVDATEPSGFAVIPCSSTKIKAYKQALYALRAIKTKAPLFAHRLRFKTFFDKRPKGTFFNLQIVPALADTTATVCTEADIMKSLIPPTVDGKPNPLLKAAKQFMSQIEDGAVKTDYSAGQGERVVTEETAF